MALPDSAASGRTAADSRPRTQAVPQYASDRRSWFGRTGGWPRTSRTRRPPPAAPPSPGSQPSERAAEGPAMPSTALAVPSTRLRRSLPKRAWTDPSERPSSRWMKPRTRRMPSSKASHGFRSRHWPPPGGADPAALDPERSRPDRDSHSGDWPAAAREGAPGGRRPRPEPPAGHPRSARGSPPGRRAGAAYEGRAGHRRARSPPSTTGKRSRRLAASDVRVLRDRPGPFEVVLVERRGPLVGAAPLTAADRAAVVLAGGSGIDGLALVAVRRPGPDELVGGEHPLARRATRREQLADRDLEAGLATRRGGHRLEGGVEVAEVRRPQDELREEPGQRARFRG